MNTRTIVRTTLVLFAIAILAGPAFPADQLTPEQMRSTKKHQDICGVHSISLNRIVKYFDGQWQGITSASDGYCYFGSSTHSPDHGGSFFKYNPATKELTVLAEDMTEICGEDVTKASPQGKIHSPIVEYDGWLYFTTHLSTYWANTPDKYTGAHVIGYELATGKFRDFGIMRKRFSIYSGIEVDKIHKKLYVFVTPFAKADIENDGSHLYQIDIETGNKVDLGLVQKQKRGACFWFFIDDNSDCWFTLWKAHHWKLDSDNGDLCQYDFSKNRINCYKDVLPMGKLAPDGTPVSEELSTRRSWTWIKPLPDDKKCLFTMGKTGGGDERLWIFDPSRDIESGEAFQPVAYIGSTFLAVACSNDRVFFVQYDDLHDARTYSPEKERDKLSKDLGFNAELHLRSIRIDQGTDRNVVDHGRIIDQDGRPATMIDSLAADERGNVYMVGSWNSLSTEESTHRYRWKDDTYEVLHRGQFFAHVNIP